MKHAVPLLLLNFKGAVVTLDATGKQRLRHKLSKPGEACYTQRDQGSSTNKSKLVWRFKPAAFPIEHSYHRAVEAASSIETRPGKADQPATELPPLHRQSHGWVNHHCDGIGRRRQL